ncbi:hypothetical protein SS1G_09643 [Sclerotinia sclerotiorum 1980 UF-70]|uniref:Uncharacterized protein n=1 Tax=Sclerotinia sclerotiorum (strain ATCC 18683 / 1980 / Ss-1) TaxID=665079 RepID=A7EWD4_SCLS1|nr:hypothetical protein SS1G_09643 [Sclerotinia sclerotiorum 1980 UF-70]EDN93776.1 hypothetical protein SS1G_09643 [Sclerotinia sclerotiorum 1980 UF-70]
MHVEVFLPCLAKLLLGLGWGRNFFRHVDCGASGPNLRLMELTLGVFF